MRVGRYAWLAALFVLFPIESSQAVESVVLPAKGDACQTISPDRESVFWRCPGPGGFGFTYMDHVTFGGLSFGRRGRENALSEDIGWPPAGDGIGSRIEWRVTDGQPFAAIVARWRQVDPEENKRIVVELLVVRVIDKGGCAIASIGAFRPNALNEARAIADKRGPSFRCGTDKPIFETDEASGAVTKRDGHFATTETLEHNASIVVLTHSQNVTEIRYSEPKKSLLVKPGTLLFRGEERNGELRGEAFVFKAGCEPAGYAVAGRRERGILVLEGTPPHWRGCSVTRGSAKSRHARLVFNVEPVLDGQVSAGATSANIRAEGVRR